MLRSVLAVTISLALGMSAAVARPKPADPSSAQMRWAAWEQHQALRDKSLFNGLNWRSIGPTVQGGRVVDIAPIPGQPYGFYVAYATGGVWKTSNNGVSFEPLTDQLPTTVVGAIAVDPKHPQRLWVGTGESNSSRSSYGGLGMFRSDDGGKSFVRSGLEDSDRIGRISVDPRDGEHVCVAVLGRLYSTGGSRGVFCTADGGAHWTQSLKNENGWTGAVDLLRDPANADVLYAATWERARAAWNFEEGGVGSGVWKSVDNGKSWSRLAGGFPGGAKIGRIGLTIALSDPNILYASVDRWDELPAEQSDLGDRPLSPKRLKSMSKEEFLRQDPEEIESFIRDNDLDTELDAKTLIEKLKKDQIKMADLVEALNDAEAALFKAEIHGLEVWRSNDAGATWKRTHDEPIREVTYTYGYYFSTIRVAPDNPQRLYMVGVPMITSEDGGKSWKTLQNAKVHVDYHAWWIDPTNAQHMIVGNDGGVDMSYDGGKSWIKLDAQPLGQFYSVGVDNADPYNVYGGLQDNGSLRGSSKTRWELGQDWTVIGGGDGMEVAIDGRETPTVYTGYQFGYYQRSGPGGTHEVRPREKLTETPLRYNWKTPVVLSPHLPDIVYFGTQKLMRSMDRGESWTAISPDLTTSKNRGDVPFATITSISESPKQFGLLWIGTDDGNVWVTQGGGDSWSNVGANLPADRWVTRVVASAHERNRAYVTLNGYRNDDGTAYLYVTEDLGKSWRSLAAGLPAESINVVREDPQNADVLYVGSDRGVYVSLDRGASWQTLGGNLPHVPVHDLVVHPRERELVAGTHGRSVWIIDALPVQELTAKVRDEAAHLFAINPIEGDRDWRSRAPRWFDDSDYLPKATMTFWAGQAGAATLSVVDDNQQAVREIRLDAKRGINSVDWDVLVDKDLALKAEQAALAKKATSDAKAKDEKAGDDKAAGAKAPAGDAKADQPAADEGALAKTPYAESLRLNHRLFALPGTYTVKLALNGGSSETKLEIKAPEARKPRAKPTPKVRGKDKYMGAETRGLPVPEAAAHEND